MAHIKLIGIGIMAFLMLFLSLASMQKRKRDFRSQPQLGDIDNMPEISDHGIVAVRKSSEEDSFFPESQPEEYDTPQEPAPYSDAYLQEHQQQVIVLSVMASNGRHFLGYELLQGLLGAGLRFGEMSIFHRHEQSNGKGEVLFSLASATEPGTFDLQNMGAFSCVGLTLFMQTTGQNKDRLTFELMLSTAKQLANDLEGVVCNAERQPIAQESIDAFRAGLGVIRESA